MPVNTAALAPCISRMRKQLLPRLVMLPRLVLLPLEVGWLHGGMLLKKRQARA